MATLSHAESRRLYSWWWDSHISPKNSKWLQENLADMDANVKSMIKLIEEDADSFRKRAEMYYRKRPELMKLVEEFYRAYRALAERYDHATGALRQAHRTMAEAFPDQIPMMLPDESPSGSSAADAEPHTPKFLCGHALFDSNDSSPFKRNGIPFEETDEILVKERPRQLHEMVPADEETPEKFVNGRARKGLNFDKGLLEEERQKLESRISQESERACKAESELDSLKNSVLKLESEKEVVALQNQLSQERISSLESDISCMQEEFRKLNGEMLSGITKLKTAEDQCHLLEKKNESLQSELDLFKERAKELQEELNMKEDELQKLSLSVKDEHHRYVQAEMARKFLEELHAQSREEVRLLALEIEKWAEKLEHAQRDKVSLEDEIRRLKEEILGLNEQYSSCSLKILNLQHEIKLLEESKRKLEDEVTMLLGEKKALQEEVSSLKDDKKDSGKRHNALTEQIGTVHVNVESLQILVKELRDGNLELKDLCKKREDERSLHLESLKYLEKVTEQNTVLQNSLTKATAELEELKEKVMALEESCKTLHGKISMHKSEKSLLVRQVEAIARNMEMLLEKIALLENSHSDVNVELDGLRGMLNASEQFCESLSAQISGLLEEKSTLVNKVESIGYCLENLESRFTALDDKKLNLEREKDRALDQVTQLQHSFQLQKEENETIMRSRKTQLANLEKQISILEGNVYVREEELEMERHKVIHAQIEIFILQRCLFDMREKYLTLSDKCLEYVKTLKRKEEIILKLEQEISMHKKRLTLLSDYNEKLVEGIHQVMRMLDISNKCQPQDDQIFSLVLLKIEDLKSSILDVQDDSHRLILEKSVILSFLKQFALNAAELASQKDFVEQESEKRFWELSVLQSGRHQLLELNELLRNNVEACKQREEVLQCESDILYQQLSDLQEAYSRSQSEISMLIDSGKSFSKKINDLIEENDALEEENSALVAEAMKLEHLYCFFKSLSVERASDLQLLNNNMYQLLEINGILGQEIRSLNENLRAAEVENARLKDSLVTLEECRRQLVILENEVKTTRNTCEQQNVQIEVGKNILVEKDMELLVEHEKFQAVQDKNTELNGIIQSLTMNLDVSKEAKEELEKKNVTLLGLNTNINNQIAVLHQANDALKQQLHKLLEEMDELKYRERHLNSELQNRTEEVSSCQAEIEALLNDIQITAVNLLIFEEKMSELLIKCESLEVCAIMQKEMSHDEITKRTVIEKNLKEELDAMDGENRSLKEELSAYVPLVLAVQDCVTSLEGHILSLAKHHLSNQEQQDNHHSLQQNCSEERNEVCSATPPFGISELQKLLAKVSALEKVVIDIQVRSEQSEFIPHSSMQSAKKEAEGLKLKGTACIEELPIAKDIILHLKRREESGNTRKANAEISIEQIMKDIQLDHILTSLNYENGSTSRPPSVTCSDEVRDQMMEFWETIDANKLKPSPMSSEHEIECHQIEAIEEVKSKYKQVTDEELSTDKLANEERTESIREKLSSDAERLSLLQKSVMELNMIMENSELNRSPTSFEFKKVKAQLEEAEDAILQFTETNKKLKKKAEKISSPYRGPIDEIDLENSSERKLSDRIRRVSEKIGRLELELQKLEYIWLKLREEHDYRMARAANRRTRVLLKDYLYGRRESPRRRKVHCCACMRPRTKDD